MSEPASPKDQPRAAVPVRRTRAVPMVIPSSRTDDDPPPSVKGAPGAPKPRVVGARNPNETGMLPLQPVTGGKPSPADASATTFFALPGAPRAERPRPPPTPTAVSMEADAAPAPSLITGPAVGARPVAAPVAAPDSGDSRVVSWRVWALLLAVFGLMGLFVLAVLGVWLIQNRDQGEVVTPTPVPVTTPVVETAPMEVPSADPMVLTPVAPIYRPRPPSNNTTTTPVATVPTPPVASTGTVSISFSGDSVPAAVEVVCNSTGFRERGTVSGNRVSIPNVPVGAGCQAVPKGLPASNFTVKAGGSYACAVIGTTTSCN